MNKSDKLEIASVWRRLAAGLYDAFLIGAIWFALAGLSVIINHGEALTGKTSQLLLLPLLFSTYFFYCWFWLHGGQTLGMRAWRLRLESTHGKLGLKACSLRFLISLLLFGISFFWSFLNKNKASLHDHFSKTQVVLLEKEVRN